MADGNGWTCTFETPLGDITERAQLGQGQEVQKWVDQTCLRRCAPYVPFRTGTLLRSGTLNTVIGSGLVKYSAPYCRAAYYKNGGHGQEGTARGGLRGRKWFARMKAAYGREIKKGAASLIERLMRNGGQ